VCLRTACSLLKSASPCGICGAQSGTETGFLRVLRVCLVSIVPPLTIYDHGGECEDNCLLFALMMEAVQTSETLVNLCQSTRR
jgi:hypothetical protein